MKHSFTKWGESIRVALANNRRQLSLNKVRVLNLDWQWAVVSIKSLVWNDSRMMNALWFVIHTHSLQLLYKTIHKSCVESSEISKFSFAFLGVWVDNIIGVPQSISKHSLQVFAQPTLMILRGPIPSPWKYSTLSQEFRQKGFGLFLLLLWFFTNLQCCLLAAHKIHTTGATYQLSHANNGVIPTILVSLKWLQQRKLHEWKDQSMSGMLLRAWRLPFVSLSL